MSHFGRFIGLVLAATMGLHAEAAAPEADGDIRPVKVEITGHGFEIHVLKNDTLAFKNRAYVWSEIPPGIEGLRYTWMLGGATATVHLKAKESGRVYVGLVANQMLALRELGWTLPTPERSNTFTYNDPPQTLMIIMSHEVREGEELDVPQLGFAGTIVLLPSESSGGDQKGVKL